VLHLIPMAESTNGRNSLSRVIPTAYGAYVLRTIGDGEIIGMTVFEQGLKWAFNLSDRRKDKRYLSHAHNRQPRIPLSHVQTPESYLGTSRVIVSTFWAISRELQAPAGSRRLPQAPAGI
jgi:hypothetical protein